MNIFSSKPNKLLLASLTIGCCTGMQVLGSRPALGKTHLSITGSKVENLVAQSPIPMTIKSGGSERDGFVFLTLTVPDKNTTKSAYGGQLRLYDVHIAKMFEVTHFLCRRFGSSTSFKGHEWFYFADNGRINMGRFRITCQLAANIANAYGLGQPERTSIGLDTEGGPPQSTTDFIPTLNITGNKIDQWMNFTERFQPIKR
ncbi:hypothetical protein NG798_26835 [Ancylothrix sp. C2]|uniref:hypothetical protein n=1 Tax=Ancylothrix sp. D3o TaxID=2953691 RepID=UPI0021BB6770|nr:hypothetical protein [Ancylothrix sp. D3o]MCT7953420.1 hypothetical protein [Ancylothrix sp. D3o]